MGLAYLFLLLIPFVVFRPKDVFQPEAAVNGYYVLFIALGPVALAANSPQQFLTGQYVFTATLVLVGYLSMNFGFALASLRLKRSAHFHGAGQVLVPAGLNRSYRLPKIILLAIASIALALFFMRAGVPLLADNKELARVDALNIAGNGYLLYLATLGMPAVLLVACTRYGQQLSRRASKRRVVVVTALALCVGAALMGTGSRRYFFWCILYVLIARHYLVGRIRMRYVVLATTAGFLAVNLFEMYRNVASDTTTDLLTASYYRLIVYFYNLEATFSAFEHADKMYGSTFVMDIMTALPGKQIDYQSWIKSVTGLEFEGFGVPPTIVGDMYINFGYAGIIVGCMLFGFLVKSFYMRKVRGVHTRPIDVFIYALVLEISIRTLTSGFSAQAIGYVWITMVYAFVRVSGGLSSRSNPLAARRTVRLA